MSTQENGIYDARKLGAPKMTILGVQHMFAMFGATVLVPAITGLSVSATLLFAGLGTILFHLITKRKVPAFLGSSFAFLAGYAAIAPNGEKELLPYACLGVACAGILYLILAGLIKAFGSERVIRFFPPIVTGPIIIAIGLTLAGTAVSSCSANWPLAIIAIGIVVICNVCGKGMVKIVPIILGVLGACAIAVICTLAFGEVIDIGTDEKPQMVYAIAGVSKLVLFDSAKINAIKEAAWIGLPIKPSETVFSLIGNADGALIATSIITIVPIALATIVEHIGDISAISSTVGENYVKDPGLHRTLTGDGLATTIASVFGAPANTTYGENTGVLSLTRVFDPRVIRLAAYFAILFSFSPKLAACISAIPTPVMGGISLVLYGMISAVGVRNVVESHIDFSKVRNVIIAAMILGLSVGIKYYDPSGCVTLSIGSVDIPLTGLAIGAFIGIILNAILPFDKEPELTGLKKDISNEGVIVSKTQQKKINRSRKKH
ncbi:MAG: uracil-xanthine permease family protein [Clostridia bacterium]|nr:uracil-xanthine permease family protein [Clostridia bacterium]